MSVPLSLSRPSLLVLGVAAFVICASPAWATDAPPAKKKPAAKVTLPDLSPEQLSNAERVHTGATPCEFNQSVSISPATEKAGYFKVAFKGKSYMMAPEPTTTGAVRLEDKKNGLVWLQIANKSMLMNAKIGRRMVDNCVHPNQKT
jgi:hypothetical protein